MQQLLVTAEKDGLSATVETLKTESIVSYEEVEHAFTELDFMRPHSRESCVKHNWILNAVEWNMMNGNSVSVII